MRTTKKPIMRVRDLDTAKVATIHHGPVEHQVFYRRDASDDFTATYAHFESRKGTITKGIAGDVEFYRFTDETGNAVTIFVPMGTKIS